MDDIFAISTGILFGLGVFQLLRRDLIKVALGFYILYAAINLFILAVGVFDGETSAYVYPDLEHHPEAQVYLGDDHETLAPESETPSDPVVQALILTAIVISFGSYALLLGLINGASDRFGTIDADEVDQLKL